MTKELPKDPDERQRRTLWTVLLLNAAIAIGFFATGALGNSSALIANGLDNTSDSFVYAISLFALSRSDKWKRAAANVSGGLLLIFAAGILIDAVRRFYTGSEPLGPLMISMALIAAVVNGICIWLLGRLEDPDVNVRAANTFSLNDFISNGGDSRRRRSGLVAGQQLARSGGRYRGRRRRRLGRYRNPARRAWRAPQGGPSR